MNEREQRRAKKEKRGSEIYDGVYETILQRTGRPEWRELRMGEKTHISAEWCSFV
jgi:hypothetical protein